MKIVNRTTLPSLHPLSDPPIRLLFTGKQFIGLVARAQGNDLSLKPRCICNSPIAAGALFCRDMHMMQLKIALETDNSLFMSTLGGRNFKKGV